jgi:hypothetical protein
MGTPSMAIPHKRWANTDDPGSWTSTNSGVVRGVKGRSTYISTGAETIGMLPLELKPCAYPTRYENKLHT